jgi:4-hydroxy-3-methylbut-2-enyl diphosphate reductase
VIFSALAVAKTVTAKPARQLFYLDATCPVSKVHVEAERHAAAGRSIILVDNAGHPEVIGTMGQLPRGP